MCMRRAGVAELELAEAAAAYFRDLQTRICSAFEALEENGRFTDRPWSMPAGHRLQVGGIMRLMRAQVFEKVGVNVSHVWGTLAPEFKDKIPGAEESGGRFQAGGISLVAHPYNPHVPAV